MCQFLPSDIARLVFEYLEDTKCHKSSLSFLYESPYLDECRKVMGNGVKYRRREESLLSILQEYCDLTAKENAAVQLMQHPTFSPIPDNIVHNSALISQKPADTDLVFKIPDKNTYCSLRRHVIRLQNLVAQFMSCIKSSSQHHNLDSFKVIDFLENESNLDSAPLSNSQASVADVYTSTLSKSAETTEHSAMLSKESHIVDQIVNINTKKLSFYTESKKSQAVFPHNPVQHDQAVPQGKNVKLNPENVKYLDVALKELCASLLDKLEHSYQGDTPSSNSSSNSLLLNPDTFASNERCDDDTQTNEILINHMIHTWNSNCSKQVSISEQNLSHNLCENSVIEIPAVKSSEAASENTPLNKAICSKGSWRISKKNDYQPHILDVHHKMLPSVSSCMVPKNYDVDNVMKNNYLDLTKNELNTSKSNDSISSDLMGFSSDDTEKSVLHVLPKRTKRKKSGKRLKGKKKVVKQIDDILNQTAVETINCKPSSEKKDLVQTIPTPQLSHVFPGSSDIMQNENNAVTFMYTFPNAIPTLPGVQSNPQACIILCQNLVPTVGNSSLPIPSGIQEVPTASSSTMNQVTPSTPVGSTVTRKKNSSKKTRSVRKNLFDLPIEKSNLLLAKRHIYRLPKLQPVHSVLQPPLNNITQGSPFQLNDKQDASQVDSAMTENLMETNNQAASSANTDSSSLKVDISMEDLPLKVLALSPDLSNQDQKVIKKRRYTKDSCAEKG